MTKDLGAMTPASLALAHTYIESGRMLGKIGLWAMREETD